MTPQPTAREALDAARSGLAIARHAANSGDSRGQERFAMVAIDSAATTLLDPEATKPQIVAARYFLSEGLALDGRAGDCGTDSIHTADEIAALDSDQKEWLRNYLDSTGPCIGFADAGIGR